MVSQAPVSVRSPRPVRHRPSPAAVRPPFPAVAASCSRLPYRCQRSPGAVVRRQLFPAPVPQRAPGRGTAPVGSGCRSARLCAPPQRHSGRLGASSVHKVSGPDPRKRRESRISPRVVGSLLVCEKAPLVGISTCLVGSVSVSGAVGPDRQAITTRRARRPPADDRGGSVIVMAWKSAIPGPAGVAGMAMPRR